jgi:uncharacterized protein (DUF433 family)
MTVTEVLLRENRDSDRAKMLARTVSVHPDRLGGEPCFAGTRVPVKNLFDYLEGGDSLDDSLDDFLEGFPGVTREQAIAVLELAGQSLLQQLKAA